MDRASAPVSANAACKVHVDGAAVRSCVTPLSAVTGRIVTLEELGTDANPHPRASQC
jgi:aerobic-type carbon monoxide dehydrogenase small subunit (CoxS/CutS family)